MHYVFVKFEKKARPFNVCIHKFKLENKSHIIHHLSLYSSESLLMGIARQEKISESSITIEANISVRCTNDLQYSSAKVTRFKDDGITTSVR